MPDAIRWFKCKLKPPKNLTKTTIRAFATSSKMFQFQFQLDTTYIHLEPFVGCYVQIYVPADRSHTTLRLVSNFGSQQSNENVLEYN